MTIDPAAFYGSTAWRMTRRQARVDNRRRHGGRLTCTLCRTVVEGRFEAVVDHVVPIRIDPARALDLSNLRVLCRPCDAQRHAEKGDRRTQLDALARRAYSSKARGQGQGGALSVSQGQGPLVAPQAFSLRQGRGPSLLDLAATLIARHHQAAPPADPISTPPTERDPDATTP